MRQRQKIAWKMSHSSCPFQFYMWKILYPCYFSLTGRLYSQKDNWMHDLRFYVRDVDLAVQTSFLNAAPWFYAASPAEQYSWNSTFKVEIKSIGHFETKSWVLKSLLPAWQFVHLQGNAKRLGLKTEKKVILFIKGKK